MPANANRQIRFIAFWLGIAASACGSSDEVNYGPPGGLTGKSLPSPADQGSADAASSGSSATGSGSSAATVDAGNRPEGGTADGSSSSAGCGVSWSGQIFPAMMSTGKWKCADAACHGSGLQSPKMTADPTATYKTLAAYTMAISPKKLPYILSGQSDPSLSGIECNLSGTACGPQMPLSTNGAQLLGSQDLQMVDTWVKCGAPDN